MEVIAVLYMQDWHICVPADFSLGFEGDNNAVALEISTDLPEGWDLKVDVEKDGEKKIRQIIIPTCLQVRESSIKRKD